VRCLETTAGRPRGASWLAEKDAIPWTLVQGTIHARTLKNKLPFPVHVAGVLDQNRPGRAFLRPATSPACLLTMERSAQVRPTIVRVCSRWRRLHCPYGPRQQIVVKKVREGRCGVCGVVRAGGRGHERP